MAPPIGSCERAWWCTVGMGCASTPSQQKYNVVPKRYGSISHVLMSRDSLVWEPCTSDRSRTQQDHCPGNKTCSRVAATTEGWKLGSARRASLCAVEPGCLDPGRTRSWGPGGTESDPTHFPARRGALA